MCLRFDYIDQVSIPEGIVAGHNTESRFSISLFIKLLPTMFSQVSRTVVKAGVRNYKVAVLGAGGGIGQPLSLLLKLNSDVSELALFDVVRTPGVAADISHCCTPAKVIFCW